uniref:Uncharacterized protein n=1 Tax=Pseudictyota dubia TaxID=2749911 RepID=A0A7R9ZGP5_9STRA
MPTGNPSLLLLPPRDHDRDVIAVQQYLAADLRLHDPARIAWIGTVLDGVVDHDVDEIVEASQRASDFGGPSHDDPDGRADRLVDQFEGEDAVRHIAVLLLVFWPGLIS